MNSIITIKRKLNIRIDPKSLIKLQSKQYLGIVFTYFYTPKPINHNKILLNHTNIYLLNNNKFEIYPIKIGKVTKKFIYEYLNNNFNIVKKDIKLIRNLYSIDNLNIYCITLGKKDIINIPNFKWRTYLDFYTYDNDSTFDDIYYNITKKNKNLHLSNKLYANRS